MGSKEEALKKAKELEEKHLPTDKEIKKEDVDFLKSKNKIDKIIKK